MVKRSLCPRSRVVALLTSCRETGLNVIRIRGAVEVFDMARSAIGRRADKLTIDVALRAGHADVRALQREFREGVVIEGRWIPRRGVVASLAGGRESRLRVRRIIGLVEVGHVTADASSWCPVELSSQVASAAIQVGVRACQRKMRRRVRSMVELRAHPVVHAVALFTSGGQVERDVIDADGLGVSEVLLMAGVTHRGQALELADRSTLMTGIAVDSSVGADERETIKVLIDLLNRNVPSLHGVALFAVGPHLALVNIRVAVGTLRSDV